MTRMKTILIVEDDADIRDLIQMTLELTTDYLILSASDGVDAWEKINNGPIDLVVTDFRMPKMNGGELSRLIKERFPHIPIILISSYDPEEARIGHLIQSFIPKPIDPQLLKMTIEGLLVDVVVA